MCSELLIAKTGVCVFHAGVPDDGSVEPTQKILKEKTVFL